MSNHSVSAMTGLTAPKRRNKGGAKVVDAKVSDLASALQSGKAVLDATVILANALRSSRRAAPVAVKAPPAVKHAAKSSSKPSAKGVISAKGWHPAKITDAPPHFQGKAGTVDD